MNPQNKQRGGLDFRFLIFLGIIFILILFVGYFFYGLQSASDKQTQFQFKIVPGDSFKNVSAKLSQDKLITSISMFKLYSLLTGAAKKIQPGIFSLSESMTIPEIIKTITSSEKNETAVIIPEGSTLKDIDFILSSSGVIQKDELNKFDFKKITVEYPFLNNISSLEGFLFPDTYRFHFNTPIEVVVDRLIKNFETKTWNLLKENKDWYQRLILASYLEREVIDFEDKQIVAGIIIKRWRANWPLQVDATIAYAKCNGEIKNCDNLKIIKDDLLVSSSYNTYQKLGWTPTPIANSGATTVKAALTPKSSSYWYYLSAKESKETIFSKTLEEHNKNRVKYL